MSGRLIPPHGGYRRLRSFQCAQSVYDATVLFCDRVVDRRSRTRDQMVPAARSGLQNIAEGSMASATSKKAELRLTGVARAPAWRSCCSTTRISCVSEASRSGPRARPRLWR